MSGAIPIRPLHHSQVQLYWLRVLEYDTSPMANWLYRQQGAGEFAAGHTHATCALNQCELRSPTRIYLSQP